jgi:hypothetical protein
MVIQTLISLRTHMTTVRKLLKDMGIEAGVPIEPDEQSVLIETTAVLPG